MATIDSGKDEGNQPLAAASAAVEAQQPSQLPRRGQMDHNATPKSNLKRKREGSTSDDGDQKPPARGKSSPQEDLFSAGSQNNDDPNLASSSKSTKECGDDGLVCCWNVSDNESDDDDDSYDEDADGEKELHQFHQHIGGTAEYETIRSDASWTKATVQVRYCDKNKEEGASFTSSEDVFVELTFSNPACNKEDAYIETYRRRFGRTGIDMSIDGQTKRYLPTDGHHCMVMAKLRPGESVTFFRKLCGGSTVGRTTNTLGQPEGCNVVPFWTPDKPGTYVTKVTRGTFSWDASFPFSIEEKEQLE